MFSDTWLMFLIVTSEEKLKYGKFAQCSNEAIFISKDTMHPTQKISVTSTQTEFCLILFNNHPYLILNTGSGLEECQDGSHSIQSPPLLCSKEQAHMWKYSIKATSSCTCLLRHIANTPAHPQEFQLVASSPVQDVFNGLCPPLRWSVSASSLRNHALHNCSLETTVMFNIAKVSNLLGHDL